MLALAACTGTIREQPLQQAYLRSFLAQPRHLIMASGVPLHGEPQLVLLGLGEPGEGFTRRFFLDPYATTLIERFLQRAPVLAGRSQIIRPGETGRLPEDLSGDMPVLFFHSNWRLLYRRLPPDPESNRLQLSVVARVIPLGQVLSGKGTLVLPNAGWHAYCVREAYAGAFLSLDEWAANDGERLRVAESQVQQQCAQELAEAFSEALQALP